MALVFGKGQWRRVNSPWMVSKVTGEFNVDKAAARTAGASTPSKVGFLEYVRHPTPTIAQKRKGEEVY